MSKVEPWGLTDHIILLLSAFEAILFVQFKYRNIWGMEIFIKVTHVNLK